ncbi:hypothetical protein SISSUDRAFT_629002 [Sistotremastrum suecicum HHB10207 ss-3]|uniref:Uncharacterized protein n=1 Tax=Sistotremastrum suecicum HHB10207 ss-3 TaxID=1314776 RepID=A0A166EG98_9AGAM|nr:hypothetical protein SISSUDRAFT_629002 [Sistotremastrum suecicum HHB10207 ss-3]
MADHPSNDATLPRVALAERSPSQGGVIQVSLGSLEDKFDKLLLLMENQIKLTEMTFKEHGEKLETLRKDALKNDQPFEPRKLEDQQTWGGLNKEAVARTKEAQSLLRLLYPFCRPFNHPPQATRMTKAVALGRTPQH